MGRQMRVPVDESGSLPTVTSQATRPSASRREDMPAPQLTAPRSASWLVSVPRPSVSPRLAVTTSSGAARSPTRTTAEPRSIDRRTAGAPEADATTFAPWCPWRTTRSSGSSTNQVTAARADRTPLSTLVRPRTLVFPPTWLGVDVKRSPFAKTRPRRTPSGWRRRHSSTSDECQQDEHLV